MEKSKITILVADKNDSILTSIQRELRRCGYSKVISAKDGKQAWNLLNDYDVSLAVLDFALDEIPGLEIVQRSRKSEELFAIPFLLTAIASEIKLIATMANMDIGGVLLKPFSQKSLMQKVESILNATKTNKDNATATATDLPSDDQTSNDTPTGTPPGQNDKPAHGAPEIIKYRHFKVLIADDSSTMLHVVQEWLGKLGFVNIVSANNGKEAWEAYKKEGDIDLVVSDWKMPGMTGIELLDKVRKENKSPETPFILVTSEASTDSILEAGRHQATGYINKPCNFIKFAAAVHKILDK